MENLKIENKEYYSKILISRASQFSLGILCFVGLIFFGSIIFANLLQKGDWMNVGIPIMGFGLLYSFIPPTEEWLYEPWQSKTEKQEQTFFN